MQIVEGNIVRLQQPNTGLPLINLQNERLYLTTNQ